ncbi:TetM/TetW/TetO/TetS family tetracycline resistance ribosomal protection protein [Glycomyces sp. TRM65418]|uniref:elongation factor G n=1 Tax=Glycomyces sp. TRM65418 TaxID=2867006 RepID=UPI001CE5EF1F|nr:TetM/TetW/TetO/TetS family tetracycline resistance ribosomal protection protein [Glycomyces sp. TRM65418]MCC3765275.1 TetM/TetW/TetO/TetS family tetracycline resistance ribosomal protection protein [Glycomyces sp. TRM65418]QZD54896.1 TetM/TetW/TetO/TetS family tetracycline resistance ribosomal protection protein [Glycomyces sp. TRM65418]
MSYLNLGILAHVDAGKTSLTERLLFDAGIIDRVGSVDSGSTQTDSMDLERRRGITIQSAVVAFQLDGLTVNLIDTPGHTDFIAEVERALRVLDGAVLVVSAVEGVQAQTRVLFRTLERLGVPTLLFVNKVDRRGAREADLLEDMASLLSPRLLPMSTVRDIGSREAAVRPFGFGERAFREQAVEMLTEGSDEFLAAYLEDPDSLDCEAELAAQVRSGAAHPVYFGSAVTGAGVAALTEGIRRYLPVPRRDAEGEPVGTVFKVEHGQAGQKVAYIRLHRGRIAPREQLTSFRRTDGAVESFDGKVTAVEVFATGTTTAPAVAEPGSIAKVKGLTEVRIGDAIGSEEALAGGGFFTPPTLETVVRPAQPRDRIRLNRALLSLAERDPLVDPHLDELSEEMAVRLYGEVQKEVVASLLAEEFGIEVEFEETRAIHVERPIREAAALHEMGPWQQTPHLATVGLRLEPGEPGSGLRYELEVERGSLTRALRNAVEETVHRVLKRGLYGWAVTDCRVALTATGYIGKASTANDFREVTAFLLDGMLKESGPAVCEPVNRFDVEFPAGTGNAVLKALGEGRADIKGQFSTETTGYVSGFMPTEAVHGFERRLPGLTEGLAIFTTEFAEYRPVYGTPPRRGSAEEQR